MRTQVFAFAATILLAAAACPRMACAEADRDFVFTDDEGHLVLRFVGIGHEELDANQRQEVVDATLSTMVHDRLRADNLFDAEPVDAQWSRSMEALLTATRGDLGDEFFSFYVACRSQTCRVFLEERMRPDVAGHQALMGRVQRVYEAFIEAHPGSFDAVFMLAGYDQDEQTPSIKVFLHRAKASD
jgi:hypothetical protein